MGDALLKMRVPKTDWRGCTGELGGQASSPIKGSRIGADKELGLKSRKLGRKIRHQRQLSEFGMDQGREDRGALCLKACNGSDWC